MQSVSPATEGGADGVEGHATLQFLYEGSNEQAS